jgi:hypothetical protein
MMETLHNATLGTLLAIVMAIPTGVLGAQYWTHSIAELAFQIDPRVLTIGELSGVGTAVCGGFRTRASGRDNCPFVFETIM